MPTGPRPQPPSKPSWSMDYALNVILVVVSAFCLVVISLLLWIASLLMECTRLARELQKARRWNEIYWGEFRKRRERL